MDLKHIVIVGGGFAGVCCARGLAGDKRFQVTLISDRKNFEYHPSIFSTRGGVRCLEVAVPLRDALGRPNNVDVVEGLVVKIDSKRNKIWTQNGEYSYDELVIAVGSAPNYAGIRDLPQNSHGIYTQQQAASLRTLLEVKKSSRDMQMERYVVVGAGLCGVELAADIAEYCGRRGAEVALVEASPRILPGLSERLSRRVAARLTRLGVKIFTSTSVHGKSADFLHLPEGSTKTNNVVWCAGKIQNALVSAHPGIFKLSPDGRIVVDQSLRVQKNIWVIGDAAAVKFSGWAETAVNDGKHVAASIKRAAFGQTPDPRRYVQPITFIAAGRDWYAADMRSRQLYGFSGWAARYFWHQKLLYAAMPIRIALRYLFTGSNYR